MRYYPLVYKKREQIVGFDETVQIFYEECGLVSGGKSTHGKFLRRGTVKNFTLLVHLKPK